MASSKKPPDGFDPLRPADDEPLEDPHLERTSPYDVETLAAALTRASSDEAEAPNKAFIDFAPTERSESLKAPADERPRPDPRLFLDDTEVNPAGAPPAPVLRGRPVTYGLPPPPVKTPSAGVAALPTPQPTDADTSRPPPSTDRDVTPEAMTQSSERALVVPTGPMTGGAPIPADVSIPNLPVVPRAVPAALRTEPGLTSPTPVTASAPPDLDDEESDQTTLVRPGGLTPALVEEALPDLEPLPDDDLAPVETQPVPAPVTVPGEPTEAPAPMPSFDITREMTADASLLVTPADTASVAPPGRSRPTLLALVGLFAVSAAAFFAFTLFATAGPTASDVAAIDSTSPASDAPERATPPAPVATSAKARATDEPVAEDHAPTPVDAASTGDALPPEDTRPPASAPATTAMKAKAKAKAKTKAKARAKAKTKARAQAKTKTTGRAQRHTRRVDIYVVGMRNGSRERTSGLLSALKTGLSSSVGKTPRLRMGRGAPIDGAVQIRLRLEDIEVHKQGKRKRLVASCSLAVHKAPKGIALARVGATGVSRGPRVTPALQLASARACGEQVGDELRSVFLSRR